MPKAGCSSMLSAVSAHASPVGSSPHWRVVALRLHRYRTPASARCSQCRARNCCANCDSCTRMAATAEARTQSSPWRARSGGRILWSGWARFPGLCRSCMPAIAGWLRNVAALRRPLLAMATPSSLGHFMFQYRKGARLRRQPLQKLGPFGAIAASNLVQRLRLIQARATSAPAKTCS